MENLHLEIHSHRKSGHLASQTRAVVLYTETMWPVAFEVAKDNVFICNVSGADDRKTLKPEGPQCRVYGFLLH